MVGASLGAPRRVPAEESCSAVAAELVAFGEELSLAGAAQTGGAFTDVPEADAFLKASPNAFLIGVLFTQGIPAERAWAGPWLLAGRLGHFDLYRLAHERERVLEAFAAQPCMHRFKTTLAGWVSDAAAKLLDEYDGDASRIWEAGSSVADVGERLSAFPGIGRKKAAMAAEILTRHFGVELRGAEDGRVAYDVHVRRVFLRSGLAPVDTPDAIDAAASRACPASPGLLDLPAWLIGREWCRPAVPACEACRLGEVCPRLTAIRVEGVGVRRAGRPRR
jgi:uncharacterized HhH-GPD family protein